MVKRLSDDDKNHKNPKNPKNPIGSNAGSTGGNCITRASFPLFQMIYNEVCEQKELHKIEPVTAAMRGRICKIVKDMDEYHMELVYAIIRCYHLQVDRRPIFENPYQMKKVRAFQFRFDIDNLPTDLVLILDHFVALYERKKEQDIPPLGDNHTSHYVGSRPQTPKSIGQNLSNIT